MWLEFWGLCVCKTHQTLLLNWEHFVCKLCLTEFSDVLELGRFPCFRTKMCSPVMDLGTRNGQSCGQGSASFAHAATRPSGVVPAVCGHAAHLCALFLLFSLCNTQLRRCLQPLCLQSQNTCCPALCEMFKPWLVFSARVRAFPPASASHVPVGL